MYLVLRIRFTGYLHFLAQVLSSIRPVLCGNDERDKSVEIPKRKKAPPSHINVMVCGPAGKHTCAKMIPFGVKYDRTTSGAESIKC